MFNEMFNEAPPIFMFGYDRSGTTLLSMIAGAHPDLAMPFSVTGLWYRYAADLDRFGGLATPDDIARLVDALLAEERIQIWDAKLDREALLEGLPAKSFSAVVARFHEAYAIAKAKPRWSNMDIATLTEMPIANTWFPDARFVHIVRDGRDVALSHKHYQYSVGNFVDVARQWRARVETNLRMGAMLGPERYRVVRFEDLVRDTARTLADLCAFLGLSYSDDMLNYTDMVGDKVPEEKRALWPVLDKPPQPDKCDQWKRKMSRSTRLVFEDVAGPLLDELGYAVEANPSVSPIAEMKGVFYQLDRGDRLARFRRRFKK
ncbi:MAG: sulfotransferase [Pseudomonadota bacterium]